MWCAVSVNEWRKEAWGKYKGEKLYRNSKGEWYYFIDEDEAQQKVIGDDKEAERLVFSVNELTDDSYSTPLEPLQISAESGKIKFQKQLSVNPLMKPEAGIKSVRVKTQGAIGAIISATIEFTVHNKYDFEHIFLPFFMKPGAIVCLDYGWSDAPLYNIVSQIKEKDIDMKGFDKFIYHPDSGYLANNYGKVRTVIGNVVSYDANMNSEGGFDCSIEIVSRNVGLLEKKLDGDLQNLFVNSINDILALLFSISRGLDNHFSFAHIYLPLYTVISIFLRLGTVFFFLGSILAIAVCNLRLIPLFGAFLPLLTLDAAFVTVVNAFLALLITPFLPNDVLSLIIDIPLLTAWLNLVFFLGFLFSNNSCINASPAKVGPSRRIWYVAGSNALSATPAPYSRNAGPAGAMTS